MLPPVLAVTVGIVKGSVAPMKELETPVTTLELGSTVDMMGTETLEGTVVTEGRFIVLVEAVDRIGVEEGTMVMGKPVTVLKTGGSGLQPVPCGTPELVCLLIGLSSNVTHFPPNGSAISFG